MQPGGAPTASPSSLHRIKIDNSFRLRVRDRIPHPGEAANFYDLFRDAQRVLHILPLRDLYSAKDTHISLALRTA